MFSCSCFSRDNVGDDARGASALKVVSLNVMMMMMKMRRRRRRRVKITMIMVVVVILMLLLLPPLLKRCVLSTPHMRIPTRRVFGPGVRTTLERISQRKGKDVIK